MSPLIVQFFVLQVYSQTHYLNYRLLTVGRLFLNSHNDGTRRPFQKVVFDGLLAESATRKNYPLPQPYKHMHNSPPR